VHLLEQAEFDFARETMDFQSIYHLEWWRKFSGALPMFDKQIIVLSNLLKIIKYKPSSTALVFPLGFF